MENKISESQSASCSLYSGAQLDQIKENLYNFFISTTLPTSLDTTNCTTQFTIRLAAVMEGIESGVLDPNSPLCTLFTADVNPLDIFCGPNCAFVNNSLMASKLLILSDMYFMAQNAALSPTPYALTQLMNILTASDCITALDTTNSEILQNLNTYILNISPGTITIDNVDKYWEPYFIPFYNWLFGMDTPLTCSDCPATCESCNSTDTCCCGQCYPNIGTSAKSPCTLCCDNGSVSENCINGLTCAATQSCGFVFPLDIPLPQSCCFENETCLMNTCCDNTNVCDPEGINATCYDPNTQLCVDGTTVCELGQTDICGTDNTCYDPNSQLCVDRTTVCELEQTAICGTYNTCYDPGTHTCSGNGIVCLEGEISCGFACYSSSDFDITKDTCWTINNYTPAPVGIFNSSQSTNYQKTSLSTVFNWMEKDKIWKIYSAPKMIYLIKTSWLAVYGCGNPNDDFTNNDPLCNALMIPGATSYDTPYSTSFIDKGSLLYNSISTGKVYIASPTGDPFSSTIVNSQLGITYPSLQLLINQEPNGPITYNCISSIPNFNDYYTYNTKLPNWNPPTCDSNPGTGIPKYSITETLGEVTKGYITLSLNVDLPWSLG